MGNTVRGNSLVWDGSGARPTIFDQQKFTQDNQAIEINKQTIANGKWDSWLKPIGVGVGVVNMGMNIGMYGTKKKSLKAQTNYYNEQVADSQAERTHRTNTRNHNKKVMR